MYFIVWPPPHSTRKGTKRDDRAMWYWNDRVKVWTSKEHGTAYESRAEAEEKAVVAAATSTERAPHADALGLVRTSRQLVPLVRVDMSEV